MRTLWLLRHAKAAGENPEGDHARPLTGRGERAMEALAGWARDASSFAPQLALCSTALRARQSLALLLPAFPRPPEVVYEDALYLAPARRLLNRLRKLPDATARVLLVGHNPGLQELALLLADRAPDTPAERLAEGFPTAALAGFECREGWTALASHSARLVRLLTPADIEAGRG